MDLLAAQAKVDPLAFRLRHLTDKRVIRVLEAAAERFGWVAGAAPSGRGVGVACGSWRGTLVAAMAEVAVDRKTGQVRVKRVVLAQDMGVVINPDGARQQMEGAITMGIGYALSEGHPVQGRSDPGREFRHLPDPPVLLDPGHRHGANPQPRPSGPGRW